MRNIMRINTKKKKQKRPSRFLGVKKKGVDGSRGVKVKPALYVSFLLMGRGKKKKKHVHKLSGNCYPAPMPER